MPLPALLFAALAPASFTVYAAGDIAYCGAADPRWSGAADTAALVAAGLAQDEQAMVLVLGDNAYPRGSLADYRHCYGPTWGRFRERTWPAPGNHDYATAGAAGYLAYFGKPLWYSVERGAWHIVALDSNLDPLRQAEQLAWLRADLAASTAPCTLATWHHPLYSSGWHGASAAMRPAWDILMDAGADLVLSGHDHVYERFAPQDAQGRRDEARGLRQFVVGTGGARLTPFLWPRPNSEVRDNMRTGVLRLRLMQDSYSWSFLEASNEGSPAGPEPDRGSARCHGQHTD
ncbi:MAG: metallophosphoesterase [Pseudomonadota bacterium]